MINTNRLFLKTRYNRYKPCQSQSTVAQFVEHTICYLITGDGKKSGRASNKASCFLSLGISELIAGHFPICKEASDKAMELPGTIQGKHQFSGWGTMDNPQVPCGIALSVSTVTSWTSTFVCRWFLLPQLQCGHQLNSLSRFNKSHCPIDSYSDMCKFSDSLQFHGRTAHRQSSQVVHRPYLIGWNVTPSHFQESERSNHQHLRDPITNIWEIHRSHPGEAINQAVLPIGMSDLLRQSAAKVRDGAVEWSAGCYPVFSRKWCKSWCLKHCSVVYEWWYCFIFVGRLNTYDPKLWFFIVADQTGDMLVNLIDHSGWSTLVDQRFSHFLDPWTGFPSELG